MSAPPAHNAEQIHYAAMAWEGVEQEKTNRSQAIDALVALRAIVGTPPRDRQRT